MTQNSVAAADGRIEGQKEVCCCVPPVMTLEVLEEDPKNFGRHLCYDLFGARYCAKQSREFMFFGHRIPDPHNLNLKSAGLQLEKSYPDDEAAPAPPHPIPIDDRYGR
jgi:hypothetical protein